MKFRSIISCIAISSCLCFTASAKASPKIANAADVFMDQFIGELLATEAETPKATITATDPNQTEVTKTVTIEAKETAPKPKAAVKAPEAKQIANSDMTPAKTEYSKQLRENLRKSSLAPLRDTKQNTEDSDLMRMIKQLRSLDFVEKTESPEKTETKTDKVVESKETADAVVEDTAVDKEADTVESEPAATIKKNILPENPAEIIDARQLAETLFLAGRKIEAAKYYQLVLNRLGDDNSATNVDREWILFQLGNSLYATDTAAAEKTYEQFMREYPGSDWVRCASIKRQILRWKLKDKPEDIVKPTPRKVIRKQTIVSSN